MQSEIYEINKYDTIEFTVIWLKLYNSLVVACQNVPTTSVLTNFTLGSWKDFDVGLSLIGSKELTWKTSFDSTQRWYQLRKFSEFAEKDFQKPSCVSAAPLFFPNHLAALTISCEGSVNKQIKELLITCIWSFLQCLWFLPFTKKKMLSSVFWKEDLNGHEAVWSPQADFHTFRKLKTTFSWQTDVPYRLHCFCRWQCNFCFSSSSSCIFNICLGILRLCKTLLMSLACRHISKADTQERNMSENKSPVAKLWHLVDTSRRGVTSYFLIYWMFPRLPRNVSPVLFIGKKGSRESSVKYLSYFLNVNRFHFPLFPSIP